MRHMHGMYSRHACASPRDRQQECKPQTAHPRWTVDGHTSSVWMLPSLVPWGPSCRCGGLDLPRDATPNSRVLWPQSHCASTPTGAAIPALNTPTREPELLRNLLCLPHPVPDPSWGTVPRHRAGMVTEGSLTGHQVNCWRSL